MHDVEYRIRQALDSVVSSGDRILVAVSGGPDSVVMLNILNKLKTRSPKFSLAIAHLNHLARGVDSNSDAEFVLKMADEMRLRMFIERIDVAALSHNSKTSFQETARNLRYDFLNRSLKEWGGDMIALGHNADDQAESILINMLRGSGLLGLIGTPAKKGKFFRPLYDCFRRNIEDYAKTNNLAYCIDATNNRKNYLRNRVRLELIPFLEDYNPQIKSSIIETSRLMTDDESYIQEQVDKAMVQASYYSKKMECSGLNLKFMKTQHPALQKRLIRQAILLAKGDLRAISSRHILNILRLINYSIEKREIHLPGNLTAICADEELSFCKRNYKNCNVINVEDEFVPIDINIPGYTVARSYGLSFKAMVIPIGDTINYFSNPNRAYLDYDKTGPILKMRFFRPGDRFIPLGMKGRKKLKSFFIDEKIPHSERMSVPILISKNDDIIWVYKKRIGENYRITDKTCRVLILEGECK